MKACRRNNLGSPSRVDKENQTKISRKDAEKKTLKIIDFLCALWGSAVKSGFSRDYQL